MQTDQAPAAPTATTAPAAPAAPAAPGTITIVGSDGKTQTIVLPGRAGSAIERAAEQAAQRANDPRANDEFRQGMAAGVTLSLVIMMLFRFYRRYTKRGMTPAAAQASSGSPERLERMERGIEAIAIEVERISEGQRFVTNLLAESHQPAIAERK
jgi:hypothetical protein